MYKFNITWKDINNVQKPISNHLSDSEQYMIQTFSQAVLMHSMYDNNSNEVGLVYNVLNNKWEWFFGSINSVKTNKNYSKTLNSELEHSLIFIHNHPSNSGFSFKDFKNFFDSNTYYMMIAVQNNGSLHILKKNRVTTKSYYDWIVKNFKTPSAYINAIKNGQINDIYYIYRRFKK